MQVVVGDAPHGRGIEASAPFPDDAALVEIAGNGPVGHFCVPHLLDRPGPSASSDGRPLLDDADGQVDEVSRYLGF